MVGVVAGRQRLDIGRVGVVAGNVVALCERHACSAGPRCVRTGGVRAMLVYVRTKPGFKERRVRDGPVVVIAVEGDGLARGCAAEVQEHLRGVQSRRRLLTSSVDLAAARPVARDSKVAAIPRIRHNRGDSARRSCADDGDVAVTVALDGDDAAGRAVPDRREGSRPGRQILQPEPERVERLQRAVDGGWQAGSRDGLKAVIAGSAARRVTAQRVRTSALGRALDGERATGSRCFAVIAALEAAKVDGCHSLQVGVRRPRPS